MILREAAVLRVAAEFDFAADRLPRRQAMFAVPARGVEPRHADPVAVLHGGDVRPDRRDQTDALVAGDERRRRLDGPVTARCVQVGMADPAGLGPDQDLARSGDRDRDFADFQRLGGSHEGGLHLSVMSEWFLARRSTGASGGAPTGSGGGAEADGTDRPACRARRVPGATMAPATPPQSSLRLWRRRPHSPGGRIKPRQAADRRLRLLCPAKPNAARVELRNRIDAGTGTAATSVTTSKRKSRLGVRI